MTHFRIAVTSDTVCPWCYVGRRQLQRAQQLWTQRHPADTFAVTYQPFQLNPAWPKGPASSTDKQQFYHDKFGPERTRMVQQRLSAIGAELGINFRYGGRTGNTRDSHRLVHLAKRFGNDAELRVVDGLFAAYFEKERDITQVDTLREVAVEAGIPEADFQKAIVDSDEGGAAVDEAVVRARLEGVSGVPDYKIQDRFQVNGGQPAEAFVQIFEKVKALEG
ncbi:DSBA oxidoreductase [Purpureocillium lavendulum]|uniref:DSBA oxidoreductase n=1 Tax=Purpureocillium lavendulum TaxID=1247861 RepID=A0AB34FP76_9HYPO|nr:DSBA oxidoreductase [Purpureocillium lavendulum]